MPTSTRLDARTAGEVRAEIERGARIVTYTWCVSLVVLTITRNTRPYLIRAGCAPRTAGLPWAILTLLLGWWGLPWGLINTPRALWKTLRGGTDLTDVWIDAYAARAAAALTAESVPENASATRAGGTDAIDQKSAAQFAPHLQAALQAAPASPSAPLTPEAARRLRNKRLLAFATVVAIVAGFLGVGDFLARRGRVILVNATAAPYDVLVDGMRHTLAPRSHADLGRPAAGPHTFHAVIPGLPATIFSATVNTARAGGFLEPGPLIVVNPDRLALIAEQRLEYGSEKGSAFSSKLHANADVLTLRKPDFVFEDFPQKISVKSGESSVRTRVATLDTAGATPAEIFGYLARENGPAAARAWAAQHTALSTGDTTAARPPPVPADKL